jgi:hypothetical protein
VIARQLSRSERRTLFALALLLQILVLPRAPLYGEAERHARVARLLATKGTLDVGDEPMAGTVVEAGRRLAIDGILSTLALVPAEAMLGGLGARTPVLDRSAGENRRHLQLETLLPALSAALFTAWAVALFAAGLGSLGVGPGVQLATALLLLLTTCVAQAGRSPDGSALGLLLFVALLDRGRGLVLSGGDRQTIAFSALAGMVGFVDPALVPAAAAALAFTAGRTVPQDTRLFSVACFALPFLALNGIASFIAHAGGGFAAPRGALIEGLFGLTFSTGKGLWLYAPLVLLSPAGFALWWRRSPGEAARSIVIVLVGLVAVASLQAWHGDPAFGPRRVIPLLPVLFEPVALVVARVWGMRARAPKGLVLGLGLLGLSVQSLGVMLTPPTYLRVATYVKNASGAPGWFGAEPFECHFMPQFSPIVGHAWLLRHLVTRDPRLSRDAPFRLLLATVPELDLGSFDVRPDLWWLDLTPPLRAVTVLGLGLAAGLTARRLRRVLRSYGG